MTKKNVYGIAINVLSGVEFAEKEAVLETLQKDVESMERREAKAEEASAKKAEAYEVLKEGVRNLLGEAASPMGAKEIGAALNITTNKAAYVLTKLMADEISVEKENGKASGRNVYSLA